MKIILRLSIYDKKKENHKQKKKLKIKNKIMYVCTMM